MIELLSLLVFILKRFRKTIYYTHQAKWLKYFFSNIFEGSSECHAQVNSSHTHPHILIVNDQNKKYFFTRRDIITRITRLKLEVRLQV